MTEVAGEQQAPITTEEFHTLNRCLDTAIAEAVTEHARVTEEARSAEEIERLGQLAHQIRDMLNTALIAFDILKRGTVAINGSTGAVMGRSLIDLRDIVNDTLSDVRMTGNHQRREQMLVAAFINDIAVAAALHAEFRGLQLVIEDMSVRMAVDIDPQLLGAAVMNLLSNAFKFTPPAGTVTLRAFERGGDVLIEVEDECGGIPESRADPFQPFGERRGKDRSGLGLGLSMARKAVRAHGGDITIRNIPGKGCLFVISVPCVAPAGEPALAE